MTSRQHKKSLYRYMRPSLNTHLGVVLLMLVLLVFVAVQNRFVTLYIQNRADPMQETATRLNLMIRDLDAKVIAMQSSANTFELNATSNELQQELIRLDEILYRLEQQNIESGALLALRGSAIATRTLAIRTLDLQRRKLERTREKNDAVRRLNNLHAKIALIETGEVTDSDWLKQVRTAVQMLYDAVANGNGLKIEDARQTFLAQFADIPQLKLRDMQRIQLHAELQTLGDGPQGLFTLMQEIVHLEYASRSNEEINYAILARFKQQGRNLVSRIADSIQQQLQETIHNSFLFVLCVVLLLLFTVVQTYRVRRLFSHLIPQRLNRAREAIQRHAQEPNHSLWLEEPNRVAIRDEIDLLQTESRKMFNTLVKRNQKLHMFNQLGHELAAAPDLPALIALLKARRQDFVASHLLLLGLWQAETAEYQFPLIIGESDDPHSLDLVSTGKAFLKSLGQRNHAIVLNNPRSLKPYVSQASNSDWQIIGSLMFFPLIRSNGAFQGGFCLLSAEHDAFVEEQVEAMQSLSRCVAIAIEHGSRHTTLREMQSKLHLMEKMTGMRIPPREQAETMLSAVSEQQTVMTEVQLEVERLADLAKKVQLDALNHGLEQVKQNLLLVDTKAQSVKDHLEGLRDITENEQETAGAVDLVRLLETCFRQFQSRFPEIRFALRGHKAVSVLAQEEHLIHALQDLLLNACLAIKQRLQHNRDFSPEVGVSVSASQYEVEVMMQDNGRGLAKEACLAIFEPDFEPADFAAGERISLAVAFQTIAGMEGQVTLQADSAQSNQTMLKLPALLTTDSD